MAKRPNQPRDYDVVLGGLEGVKMRLASSVVGHRIAALKEALNYGQAGLDLVIQVLKDESDLIHWAAYLLLKERAGQQAKQALQEYEGNLLTSQIPSAIAAYNEFLVYARYEIRTPLNGILGFLSLVRDGMADDPEEEREFIQEAYSSALRLLNIINDVFDFAKLEAGKMKLEMNPVKLDELLNQVQNFTQASAQHKYLSFSIQSLANFDEIVLYGNYQRLLQVMLNLVENAIKFTHTGGISISCEFINHKVLFQNQELPGLMKIEVADTGIGVPLHQQEKLFQPFSDIENFPRTCAYKSVGLGLVISKKLVEAMGGEMSFYSPGEKLGSTVTFTVPVYYYDGLTL